MSNDCLTTSNNICIESKSEPIRVYLQDKIYYYHYEYAAMDEEKLNAVLNSRPHEKRNYQTYLKIIENLSLLNTKIEKITELLLKKNRSFSIRTILSFLIYINISQIRLWEVLSFFQISSNAISNFATEMFSRTPSEIKKSLFKKR